MLTASLADSEDHTHLKGDILRLVWHKIAFGDKAPNLKIWGLWSHPSLPSLPDLTWSEEEVLFRIPSIVTQWVGYMRIHVYTRVCVCVHPYMCARVCVYMYVYAYAHVRAHSHTHLHTHTYAHIYMWQDELDSAWVLNLECWENPLTRLKKSW